MKYIKKLFARQLRGQSTNQEEKVWRYLKNRNILGFKFRRQHVIEGFVVDFYCHELSLAIEIDGKIHEKRVDYDFDRQEILSSKGIRFIRISNREIEDGIENLITKIKAARQDTLLPLGEGQG